MKKLLIIFVILLLTLNFVLAQNNNAGTINGFVYDESNLETLIGAKVSQRHL